MKNTIKKVLSFTLTLALVFSLIPIGTVVVNAADLSMDAQGLTASTDSNGTWTGGATAINGTVTGSGSILFTSAKTSTLTFKNNRSTAAKISFKYNITKNTGSVTIGGTTVTGSGTHTSEISSGGTLAIKITSGKGSTNSTAISLTAITLFVDVSATTTFKVGENGSYTVDGSKISAETVKTQSSATAYSLVATPAAGYFFHGWYSTAANGVISKMAKTTINVEADTTIYPIFGNVPTFQVGSATFNDLNEANAAAVSGSDKTIILINGGILPAGDYEISSGVKFLVPYSAANKADFDEEPEFVNYNYGGVYSTPTEFVNLTLADGATITCKGAINVNGQMYAQGGSPSSITTGTYGAIDLSANSKIILDGTAKLYAYGYIGGDGMVEAKKGTTVYQYMQLMDFRGGSIASNWDNVFENNTFMFSQYFLQNIEACLKVNCGAIMQAVTGLTMSHSLTGVVQEQVAAPIIGTDAGLFRFNANNTEDYITLKYDASTDRMILDLYGDINTQNIKMSVNLGVSVDMDTSKNILPLPMNYTVNINPGSTVTFSQKFKILPGTVINVKENASVSVSSNGAIYLYDADDWSAGKYALKQSLYQLRYVHARKKAPVTRTVTDNAILRIDGTLVSQGPIYSTKNVENGGNASFSGNGTITLSQYGNVNLLECDNNAGTDATIGTKPTATTITCVPVVGNIAGHDGFNSFATGTYYGANGVWYQHKIESQGFTVQSGGAQDENNIYVGTTKDNANINLVINTTYPCVNVTGVTSTDDGNGTYTITEIAENAIAIGKEHTIVESSPEIPAGCETSGTTAVSKCSDCGTITSMGETINPLGHSYGEWVIVDATCTVDGSKTRTCARCGATETEAIKAAGHNEVVDAAVPATCTETGLTEGKHCEVCGETIVAQTVIPAKGHTEDAGVVTTVPTCTTPGAKTYTCIECKEVTKVEEIATSGHTVVTIEATAPTCLEDGCTAGSYCSVCNEVFQESTVLPATGHDFEIYELLDKPTCQMAGFGFGNCNNCEKVGEPVDIPMVDHKDDDNNGLCDFDCGTEFAVLEGADQDTTVSNEEKIVFTTSEAISDAEALIGEGKDAIISVTPGENSSVGFYGTGTTFTVQKTENTVVTYTLIVYGDLNGDGVCDVLDTMLTARYVQNKAEPSTLEIYAASATGALDGTIDEMDYSGVVNNAIS